LRWATSTPRTASGCSGRRPDCARRSACRWAASSGSGGPPRPACRPTRCPRAGHWPHSRRPDDACRGADASSARRWSARARCSRTAAAELRRPSGCSLHYGSERTAFFYHAGTLRCQMTRLSTYFLPTEREPPADAEALAHKLMVRAGLIRQVGAGLWSWLPAGWRVHQQVVQIVREEMDAIGGQELLMPVLQPAELWRRSGRYAIEELFKLKDRREADLVLAMT